MLRSQVAVPVYNQLCTHALREQCASAFKKQTLRTINAPNQSARQVEPWIKQDLVIDGHISLPFAQMQCRRKEWASRRSIEPHEKARHRVKPRTFDTTRCDRAVEQPRLVQPLHYDKPIDNCPRPSDCEALRRHA